MKSSIFKESLESVYDVCPPDQLCVCVRMTRLAYEQLLREASRLGLSSGAYIERLLRYDPERLLH